MKKMGILFLALLLIGVLVWYGNRPEPVMVKAALLETGSVEQLVANTRAGTVRSCQRSRLSLPVGGTVAALHVRNGDRVEAGQVLLELHHEDLRARVEQALAERNAAQLTVREVCDAAARDEREAKRAATLASRKMISDDALDTAQTRSLISQVSCDRAKVGVQAAQAQLDLTEALLAQTRLVAPFAGVVAEINGEVGEFATPSPPGVATPPAVDLIADDCLYIRAPIDEVDAAAIRVGMEARVTIDAFRGQVFPAQVSRIAPYVQDFEKQARTVDVEARLTDMPEDIALLVGYSADIEVIIQRQDAVLRVPTEAVFDLDQVWQITPEGTLNQHTFKPGLANWSWTEIQSGLQVGDRVVLSLGVPGLAPDQPVRIDP
jgi:HlyD family secretion protein